MAKYRRLVVPGYPHHVTQRGVRKQTTFFENGDYITYLSLATELLHESGIEFWAYCLMPNHIHAVVVPDDNTCLSRYFAALHRRYARRTNEKHGWRGHLWQERFYSVVMDEYHALAAMRYVELNPVRAGLCAQPQHWPWSSVRANLDLICDPLIDRNATRRMVPNWHAYLGVLKTDDTIENIRNFTRSGRPEFGDEFMREIESATGRTVRRKRPGRKQK
jgi:putative transposase